MIEIPDHAILGSALREEIAQQQRHINNLEAALLPLAEAVPRLNGAEDDEPLAAGISRTDVAVARKLLGVGMSMDTDSATVAETLPSFKRWLANAAPGERCMYYAGFVAGSMYVVRRHGDPKPSERAKPPVAAEAMDASDHGLVHLVQVKMAPSNYRYYAIRANPVVVAEITAKRKANR